MNRLYPRTKWSDTVMSAIQVGSVLSEALEARDALCEDITRLDEEISDLEHSIQTYWDCREREGANVDEIRQAVIKKNRDRGYYTEEKAQSELVGLEGRE